jgi:ribosomal-protein-alanine N-acetyltransferase
MNKPPARSDMKATSRLLIRPFTLADIDQAFAWFGDPEVMRFTTGGPDRTRDDTRHRLTRYIEHQEQYGFSKWLIQERATAEAIGDAGLLILDALSPIPDLGFRFAKLHRGRGLATEVAGAWLHLAFNELRLERVSAFAHVENLASLRVLEKVGFTRLERRDVMGMDSYTYRLMRSEFAALRGDQPANMQMEPTRPTLP